MKKIRELFNFRLYLEGLKKIKLIGIAALIVTVALCAIVPIIYIAEEAGHSESIFSVAIDEFAIPLCVIMAFAPFFISSLFSYLNLRRDSDFYHAIPYKRQTVYTSFLLAALTWCLGIITAAVLGTTVLWSVAPNTTFEFYYIPLLIFGAFSACLMLMGFMTLSMSLTGTATTNIFIFGLVACFFRSVCLLFTYALENTAYVLDLSSTFLRFTDIKFFSPIAFLGASFSLIEPSEFYTNTALYIYTIAISAGLFILAGRLYVRRRSEMATKSAPTKRLQHVYRIAFTTPFVLIMFTFIAIELMGNDSMDASFYIFMCFAIAIVYFLYELITTKSAKNMLRAAPYLTILLAVGCLFVASVGLVRANVLSKNYTADEIESVTFSESGSSMYYSDNNYEDMKTRKIKVSDREVVKFVSDALDFSLDSVADGTYPSGRVLTGYEGGKATYERYVFTTIKIDLKGGGRIGRKIKISESNYDKMLIAAQNTEEYRAAYLEIPKPDSIYSIYWSRIDTDKMESVYKTFYEEYSSMTEEEKMEVKNIEADELRYQIECYGRENFTQFSFVMKITQKTPETLNAFAAAMNDVKVNVKSEQEYTEVSSYNATKELLGAYIESGGTLGTAVDDKYDYSDFNLSVSLFDASGKSVGAYNSGTKKNTVEGAEYLYDGLSDGSIRTRYQEGDSIITLDLYYYESNSVIVNTGKDSYVTEQTTMHVNTQLLLFCDKDAADGFEKYVDLDEVYNYVDDVIKDVEYYYYD